MTLPPTPVIGGARIIAGVNVLGEGYWTPWPAPAPYEDATPGCSVALDVPVAPLPQWIIERVLTKPRPRRTVQPPVRGIDVIKRQLSNFTRYSRQGTRANVVFATARAAARWIGDGGLEEAEVVELLVGAAVEAGLAPDEALAAARRGLKVGKIEQRD